MEQDDKAPLILIVCDTPGDIQLLTEALHEEFRFKVAPSDKTADEEITTHGAPDVILLDLTVPGMDAHRFCRRLKAFAETRSIPVIYVADRENEKDLERHLISGATDYLIKPINPAITKFRLHSLLLLRRGLNALAERTRTLEEANRLREDVERIARHDLKGPLNGILGFSELLGEDERLDEEQRGWVRRINQSGYRMLDMINASLNLYKMETGQYHCDMVPLDLWTILKRVLSDRESLISAKELRLELPPNGSLGGDAPFMVLGEDLLCYSMLGNLLTNALEASPAGGTITVTMEQRHGEARLAIHNSGAIPEEIRSRLFDKYVSAGKEQGTGLGTYSARLIARTQGGDVEMTTNQVEGTTVTVRLKSA